jgi:ABC-type taurine transport system ATPase subunit
MREIRKRLGFLRDVGLDYLTLDRLSSTLSGGESQRINLATSLGSALVDTLYVLDEPSIGLHPRDNERLITILRQLRDHAYRLVVGDADMIAPPLLLRSVRANRRAIVSPAASRRSCRSHGLSRPSTCATSWRFPCPRCAASRRIRSSEYSARASTT